MILESHFKNAGYPRFRVLCVLCVVATTGSGV